MEIKNIPNPVLPDWVKLYNTYDPEYYAPGKRVSAEEWNTLFLASVRQGNYNADTLELLIKTYLPETYLTKTDFNMFSAQMQDEYNTFTETTQNQYSAFTTQIQQDFTNLTEEVNSLEDRVIKAEDVAYALDDVIQEANSYAKQAYDLSEVAQGYSETAVNTANSAVNIANNAVDTATEANTTSQTALENSQNAINTANSANTAAAQAVSTANAASLRSEDAIATANAAKVESASAKNTAANAESTAANAVNTAESATVLSEDAKRIAQNALDLVTEGQGSQVLVGGVAVDIFDADTKADLDYVDRQIAALVGAAPETLDTLEELATAFEENADVVKTLEDAIVTKVAKTDIEDFLSATSTNPVQNKVLYNPVTFAESERQKSKNLFDINNCLYHKFSNLGETGTNVTTVDSTIRITLNPNNLIKVNPNTQYTLSTNNSNFKYAIGQLTSNKTTLGDNGWQTNSSFTITTSSTTEYLGLNFGKTDDSEISETDYNNFLSSLIMLEKGSVATDYQPYNGAIVHENNFALMFAENERQKSKNLLYIENTQNTTTITSYSDYVVLNGTPTSVEYPYTSSPLPTGVKFEQGKKYTFSRQLMSGIGNNNFSIGLVLQDVNGNGVLEVLIPNSQDSISFTINSNNISRYSCYINFDGTTTFVNAYYGLQIEEGSVATDYQSYNGEIVHREELDTRIKETENKIPTDYLSLSGGTMAGTIIFPYGSGLKTPDGEILLMPYAGTENNPGSFYISEKTRNTILNGYRDRPQYNSTSTGLTDIALYSDLSNYLSKSLAYREFATLIPKNGTVINNGANLNSIEYLKIGNYYQNLSASTHNMTNIPQKEAFMMTVYSPLSPTYDDETTNPWCYRARCFMTLSGDRWWQYCWTSGTAGSFAYGEWYREIHGNGGEITGTLTISGTLNLIV